RVVQGHPVPGPCGPGSVAGVRRPNPNPLAAGSARGRRSGPHFRSEVRNHSMSTLLPTTAPNRTPAGATAVVKFHASLNVSDLPRSVAFYTALLGTGPAKFYPDYAKFEIDNPPLVLSLKPKRACAGGPLNHLGLRLVTPLELDAVRTRLRAVGARM